MAGELLALIAGLMARRGREKAQHEAQDRQDQLLGQQRAASVTTNLPDFYNAARSLPDEAQTSYLAGVRSLLPAAQQGSVYVPGEVGPSAPSERVNFSSQFPTATPEDPSTPMAFGADGLATRGAPIFRPPNTVPQSVQMGAHGAINPFLRPAVKPVDPKDTLSILQALGGQNGDSRQALAAALRPNLPGINLNLPANVMSNLGASPEDAARLATADSSRATAAKTGAETSKLTQMLPLDLEGAAKDNKIKNQTIVGDTINNKLLVPKFGETVRHNKADETLNGRAIDAGLFQGNANRGVQLRAQNVSAETAANSQQTQRDIAAANAKARAAGTDPESQYIRGQQARVKSLDDVIKDANDKKIKAYTGAVGAEGPLKQRLNDVARSENQRILDAQAEQARIRTDLAKRAPKKKVSFLDSAQPRHPDTGRFVPRQITQGDASSSQASQVSIGGQQFTVSEA